MSRAIEAGSLDSLAAGIGAWHEETADPRRPRGSGRRMLRHLAPRFDAIYSRLAAFTAPPGSSEASGVEWLLDNHYLIRGALNQLVEVLTS